MAYRIREREGVAEAIRRIVAEQLDNAVGQLEGRGLEDRDEAVHDARKSLKKARSAMRLARYDLGGDVRSAENAVLRDAGRRLSGVRDAQVLLETLAGLAGDDRISTPSDGVARMREALERHREELRRQVHEGEGEARAAVQELREVRARLAEWPLDDQSLRSVARGLRRIHERGHEAMEQALAPAADDEAWHEWRKRVKDLWYSLRILEPVAPRLLGGLVAEADELSDVLGDHNDLAVLKDALGEHGGALERTHRELLAAAVTRRGTELRMRAVPLGMRLYAEEPRGLVRRIETYWRALEAQADAEAAWMAPELAGRVRELLVAKGVAPKAAERRELSAELRRLGFRVSDYADEVPRRRGGFSAGDFDALVERGRIRIGSPPAPQRRPARRSEKRSKGKKHTIEPALEVQRPDGGAPVLPSATGWTRSAVGLAQGAARRATRFLPS